MNKLRDSLDFSYNPLNLSTDIDKEEILQIKK